MTAYTATVVVEGLTLDDQADSKLAEALPGSKTREADGVVYITGSAEGPSAKAAGLAFTKTLRELFPEAMLLRLDQDLVSIPDIADRVARTRESVRLLVEGKRGPGNFPIPIGVVGEGTRIWPWAVVVKWFAEELDEDLGENPLQPEPAAAVDANLASKRLIGPDHSKGGL